MSGPGRAWSAQSAKEGLESHIQVLGLLFFLHTWTCFPIPLCVQKSTNLSKNVHVAYLCGISQARICGLRSELVL